MSEQHRRLIIGESVSIRYQELLAVRLMVALSSPRAQHLLEHHNCRQIAKERVVVDLVIEHEYANGRCSHNDELVLAKSIDGIRLRDILNSIKMEQGESLDGIGFYGEVSQMSLLKKRIRYKNRADRRVWAEHASNLTLQTLGDRLNDPMESGDSASKIDRRGRSPIPALVVWRPCRPHHSMHPCSIEPIDIIGTLCV